MRHVLLPPLAVLSLGLPSPASAQAPHPPAGDLTAARVSGLAVGPDGAPVGGAVVVTSAGGQAVSDPAGAFALAVDVPAGTASLRVTAVASLRGSQLVASALVSTPVPGGVSDAGVLELQASAVCEPSWLPTFGGGHGVSKPGAYTSVDALAVFDDGGGPDLYVGGTFTVAGGLTASNIARWDGASWSPVGSGLSGGSVTPVVSALAVFDDGGGPALYAGGAFTTAGGVAASMIARWDGASWSPLGSGIGGAGVVFPAVLALAAFDDGGGPALYAGGRFINAGGVPASGIARWDGTSWSALGSGVNSYVSALAVFDGGGGPELYAGGAFTAAGGAAANGIARWDGASWSPLETGVFPLGVSALAVFDDGGGPDLYVGGTFKDVGGVLASNVARWDGASWSSLGTGIVSTLIFPAVVSALAVFDDGGGADLYAGGMFDTAGGVTAEGIARWDGSTWSALSSDEVFAGTLAVFDDGSGPELYAGGDDFLSVGGVGANGIARWDGTSWSHLGSGMNGAVRVLAAFDDGGGPDLYASGDFTTASGGLAVNGIARWDGTSWSALGSGMNGGVSALTVFDDGGGPELYAGGNFTTAGGVAANRVARWDGASWSPVGSGVSGTANPSVYALAVFDDGGGPDLYAAGEFTSAGGAAANRIARWDGASWSALGSGMNIGVLALTVFDDGGGPDLYAGGEFTTAGGVAVNGIARWNGTSWSALGSGMSFHVHTLAVFDDGGGPDLYAGGAFTSAGGVAASRIARWDGAAWSPLGSGVNDDVHSLAVFDDGGGADLYAGGDFTTAGGVAANGIARWDGAGWSPLGSGVNHGVLALAALDDGAGLYAGGSFTSAPDSGDSFVARWGCPAVTPIPGCAGNPATLAALAPSAPLGAPLPLKVTGSLAADGLGLVVFGALGVDRNGCGLAVGGIGELLLALAPEPKLLASGALAGGSYELSPPVPSDPTLAGVTAYLQGAAVDLGLPQPIELTNALAVTLGP